MTITKETGAGTDPDANSYADVSDLRAYAADRGETLPSDDEAASVLLTKAMDYLRQYDTGHRQWIGSGPVSPTQPLAWPRADVWRDNALQAPDYMPRELEMAQCQLAIEAQTFDLLPTRQPTDVGPAILKRVEGAVTVQYANPSKVLPVAAFAKVSTLLAAILRNNGLFAVRA